MRKKIPYDEISLGEKVRLPRKFGKGEIVGIENTALLSGIDEPIFSVKAGELKFNFGLKYISKNILK